MIKFYHPDYIWFFLLVGLVLIALIFYNRQRQRLLHQLVDEPLLPRLLDDFKPGYRHLREGLYFSSLIFLVIALLGPQVGQKLVEVKRKGQDIILALDTSTSMKAEDLKPSRLERAKFECSRLIDRLQGDRVGIVAFAGTAYLQCPLTLDYSAAKLFLDAVDTGVIGTQGTALGDAIATALSAFKSPEKKHKVIIIISDGEDHEGGLEDVTAEARKQGAIIYTIGVGSYTGAPIPLRGADGSLDFKRDRTGRVVTTSLNESALKTVAELTGGKYYNLMAESNAFEKIYQDILSLEKKTLSSHEYSDYQLRYQTFGLIGLILLIAEIFLPEKAGRLKKRGNEE